MLQFQDFAAWIEIEGEARCASTRAWTNTFSGDKCLEYCVENSNKEATCWIASEEGKVFTIHWTCSKQATATWPVCGRAFVDGRPCGGKLCRPAEKNRHLVHTGIRSSPTVKKPFLFTHIDFTAVRRLSSTDDDSQMDTMSDAFGQIELVLRHVELIKDSRSSSAALLPVPEKQKHHERSKKGLVHEVGFGEDTAARASTSSGSIDIGEPLVVFRFRYRTLGRSQSSFPARELKYIHQINSLRMASRLVL
ncbi:hypothetical protein C8J56DRAFT_780578 [Mycena floridula]|nr:hypothetical protein C8J56DRAFT_780578 [Mycena floridula]